MGPKRKTRAKTYLNPLSDDELPVIEDSDLPNAADPRLPSAPTLDSLMSTDAVGAQNTLEDNNDNEDTTDRDESDSAKRPRLTVPPGVSSEPPQSLETTGNDSDIENAVTHTVLGILLDPEESTSSNGSELPGSSSIQLNSSPGGDSELIRLTEQRSGAAPRDSEDHVMDDDSLDKDVSTHDGSPETRASSSIDPGRTRPQNDATGVDHLPDAVMERMLDETWEAYCVPEEYALVRDAAANDGLTVDELLFQLRQTYVAPVDSPDFSPDEDSDQQQPDEDSPQPPEQDEVEPEEPETMNDFRNGFADEDDIQNSGNQAEIEQALEEIYQDFPELFIDPAELAAIREQYEYGRKGNLTAQELISLAFYQLKQRRNVSKGTHIDYLELVGCLMPSTPPLDPRTVQSLIQLHSGLAHVSYDVCKDNCVCYSSKYENATHCPICNTPRRNPAGSILPYIRIFLDTNSDHHVGLPWKTFDYIPIIHRLMVWWGDVNKNAELQEYPASFEQGQELPAKLSDFWDGKMVRRLRERDMLTRLSDLPFFFSTDGVNLFRKGTQCEVWPLILTSFNLPPEQRFLEDNIMCAGIIPGPKKPEDIDSFLCPLVDEFRLLEAGIKPPRNSAHPEDLRAYIVAIGGDMPAKDTIMYLLGHGSYTYCNYCTIRGVYDYNNKKVYCPLHEPRDVDPGHVDGSSDPNLDPDTSDIRPPTKDYDPYGLPMRDHGRSRHDAQHVRDHNDKRTIEVTGMLFNA